MIYDDLGEREREKERSQEDAGGFRRIYNDLGEREREREKGFRRILEDVGRVKKDVR